MIFRRGRSFLCLKLIFHTKLTVANALIFFINKDLMYILEIKKKKKKERNELAFYENLIYRLAIFIK